MIEGSFREVDFEEATRREYAAKPKWTVRAESASQPGGNFSSGVFGSDQGSRNYMLFVPDRPVAGGFPMVVMLHGCTQDPDDFAVGTQMNSLAQELGVMVLYPAQDVRANGSRCWNWFQPGDQARGAGEPELIAAMTREIMRSHPVDAKRVYVAGLSAGGAMAAILAHSYPELYAAAGVHSGLAPGTANNVASALSTMKSGPRAGTGMSGLATPVIVFHGDADRTVNPRHASLVAGFTDAGHIADRSNTSRDMRAGRGVTIRVRKDPKGRVEAEWWAVEGLGHAWSGGSTAGTYTDPQGPDASREMLRFFLARSNSSEPVQHSS